MREQLPTSTRGGPQFVHIVTVERRTAVRLRSWLPRQANGQPFVLAGEKLPSQVGAMIAGPTRVLCVGPEEWLLVSEEYDPRSLCEHFGPDLAARGLVLIDLTDGVAAFELKGPAARNLLSKGCGLDLHPSGFPAGRCARTRLAQLPVTVVCLDDTPRFELYVGRSYAHYLHSWLTDAAVGYVNSA
jgi:sarcosine oxidase, subunit gamma